MSSKFSVRTTVSDHYRTLVDVNSEKVRARDLVVVIGLPAALGALVGALMASRGLRMNEIGASIGGLATFTALLFGLVIWVFQLRMQLDRDPRVDRKGPLVTLVNELFANVNYAVLCGLLTTVLAMIAAAASNSQGVNAWWTGFLVAFVTHFVLTVLMCIKRVGSAYRQINKLPRMTPM